MTKKTRRRIVSNIYLTEVDRMLERAKEATRYGKYTYVEYPGGGKPPHRLRVVPGLEFPRSSSAPSPERRSAFSIIESRRPS
jgi:hypothetical protein